MDKLEIVKTISESVMALFTAALFYATWVLARNTKLMDRRERKQQRETDLRRCIWLAESIIAPSADQRETDSEYFTRKSVGMYNELLSLNGYIHDSDTRRQLEDVASQYTSGLLELVHPLYSKAGLIKKVETLNQRLAQEIIEWQRDLGSYQRSSN